MTHQPRRALLERGLFVAAALAIPALALYAYRALPGRPFAADDYQWLLNVSALDGGALLRAAFDPEQQRHFYRPLVWLLFWAQLRLFGTAEAGYHAVSLALHLLNAALLGWLAARLGCRRWPALAAAGFVALHPAPFEAVVWVSAQSELLASGLLLALLHLGVAGQRPVAQACLPATADPPAHATPLMPQALARPAHAALLCAALLLALLAKESAVIGLPLLLLLAADIPTVPLRAGRAWERLREAALGWRGPYLPLIVLTAGYLAVQRAITSRNYLLREGGYGLGPQLLLNPLRSLALTVAPLPNSEHADTAWLVPLGVALLAALLAVLARGGRPRRVGLALMLTLLPTAPFVSPPDSRYLYLPVLLLALLLALALQCLSGLSGSRGRAGLAAGAGLLGLALLAAQEASGREGRFAAASGPGGSLWEITSSICAGPRPARVVVVDPPLASEHADAIVRLACGPGVRPMVVARGQLDEAVRRRTVVVGFPNGSAVVERRT